METPEITPARLPLKQWSADERPREKMLSLGHKSLSDTELIAILLGSGNSRQTAVDLARSILQKANNNLNELGRMSIADFCKFNGIGKAKAVSLMAALEIGRRRKDAERSTRIKVTSSEDAYSYFKPILSDLPHEEFWVLMVNRANIIINGIRISQGGVTGTVADTRIIFLKALEEKACAIILCHNHPSGNLKPSESDIALTGKLRDAGKIMDIPVLDHIIFTDVGYYSFADEGTL